MFRKQNNYLGISIIPNTGPIGEGIALSSQGWSLSSTTSWKSEKWRGGAEPPAVVISSCYDLINNVLTELFVLPGSHSC